MDNTLYSSKNPIEKNMHKRMITFIARFLNKTEAETAEQRRQKLPLYGTTLEWIMTEYGFSDTEAYFRFIHPDEEIDEVEFDPDLRPLLKDLSTAYHLSVLTNAPAIHYERILKHLRIFDLFDGIYGIEENKLHGKPEASSYLNAVRDKGFTVENTLFLDDLPKYIKGYTALGGKAVLIDHEGRFSNLPLTEEAPFARLQSVHELPALLDKINNPDASGAEKRRGLNPPHK